MDREGVFQVVLVNSPEPLLGVIVLEGLGFKVDHATGKLEYSRPYGLAELKSHTQNISETTHSEQITGSLRRYAWRRKELYKSRRALIVKAMTGSH